MNRFAIIVTSLCVLCACTTMPENPEDSNLSNAEWAMLGEHETSMTPASGLEVCNPDIIDRRAALDTNCINVIKHAPTTGVRHHAIGLEIKKAPDRCAHSFLPKCRRKY